MNTVEQKNNHRPSMSAQVCSLDRWRHRYSRVRCIVSLIYMCSLAGNKCEELWKAWSLSPLLIWARHYVLTFDEEWTAFASADLPSWMLHPPPSGSLLPFHWHIQWCYIWLHNKLIFLFCRSAANDIQELSPLMWSTGSHLISVAA